MEGSWILITIFVVCLPLQCLTASVERVKREQADAKEQFGAQEAGFSSSTNPGNFQSWSDWMKKRSFGDFPFGDQNLQAWKEWMEKRSLLTPGSGPKFGATNNLQQWQDWMDKRGGFSNSGHEAFKGVLPMNKAQFQTWNDWMMKRGLGGLSGGNSGSSFGQPSSASFQSWGDFSKRADLSKDPDFWWDYIYKRNFGVVKPYNPFNARFGSNPNLMKWDDMFKRNSEKRKLGNSPAGFGHYKQYFTNGLQDWRNTFQGSKRAASKAKSSKHESN